MENLEQAQISFINDRISPVKAIEGGQGRGTSYTLMMDMFNKMQGQESDAGYLWLSKGDRMAEYDLRKIEAFCTGHSEIEQIGISIGTGINSITFRNAQGSVLELQVIPRNGMGRDSVNKRLRGIRYECAFANDVDEKELLCAKLWHQDLFRSDISKQLAIDIKPNGIATYRMTPVFIHDDSGRPEHFDINPDLLEQPHLPYGKEYYRDAKFSGSHRMQGVVNPG